MGAAEQPLVTVEPLEGGTVVLLTLNRPKGNILSMEMMAALRAALHNAAANTHLKLAIMRGAGGQFCYGASVEEHRKEQAPAMLTAFHALLQDVVEFPVPVAAMVEGRCLGGGFELALAGHFMFATADAQFGCPEIRLGVFPPALAALGPCRLGAALAEELTITGATVGVERLAQSGAITARLRPGAEALEDVMAFYGERLAGLSAFSLRQATRAARLGAGLPQAMQRLSELEALYQKELLTSHDGNEGIAAFVEKRPPLWEDA